VGAALASALIAAAAVTVARADDGTIGTGLNVEVLASSASASASPSTTVGGVSTTDSGTATNGTVGTTTTTTTAGTSTSAGTSTTAPASGITGVLYVSGLSWTYLPSLNPLDGALTLRFTVRNVYQQTVTATAGLWVNHFLGGAIGAPVTVPVDKLKAGETRTVEATFHGVAQWTLLTGHASLTVPGLVDQQVVAPIARDAIIWLLPWAIVLLVAAVAGLIVWRRLRPRPSVAAAAAADPAATAHGGAVPPPDEAPAEDTGDL
jgi:hypothetical protein